MPITLAQTQAVSDLAELLADFLPGKPHPFANARISFEGIARDLGLHHFWGGGSKTPAITQLLSLTLEREPKRFCTVVLEAVRRGIVYRQKKEPLTRQDIGALNDLVARVGFRIKDLHDTTFLNSLPPGSRPVTPHGDAARVSSTAGHAATPTELESLTAKLSALSILEPSPRGIAFEQFLNELFHSFGLAPRGAFRLVGEQIDGSFELDGHTYLLEAKWEGGRIGQEPLLVFAGKVGKKAIWSRGMFVSLSGFTDVGLAAFSDGKPTNIVCMDGFDLHAVLAAKADLRDVVRRKARRAAEDNRCFVPVRELIPTVI